MNGKESIVYLIQVGNYSRRGAFNKLHEKVVLIEDGTPFYDVEKHFKQQYDGFVVNIKKIEPEQITGIEKHIKHDDDGLPYPQSWIGDFRIEYTEKEKQLHDEYVKAHRSANSALISLHSEIIERYKQLFYGDIQEGGYRREYRPMELTTDEFHTRCLKFPVKAALFIEATQKCDGAIPQVPELTLPETDAEIEEQPSFDELELEAKTGNGTYASDDVPF